MKWKKRKLKRRHEVGLLLLRLLLCDLDEEEIWGLDGLEWRVVGEVCLRCRRGVAWLVKCGGERERREKDASC